MSARRLFLGSVALVAVARVACGWADDPAREPILGPAEPIGKLLIVTAGFDDATEPLPPAPISYPDWSSERGVPVPLPSRVPLRCVETPRVVGAEIPRTLQPHPDQIQGHLGQAAALLSAAGLSGEAREVEQMLSKFQHQHHDRVLLAQRQAQLAELQEEIERLKLRVERGVLADQVQVSIKILKADGRRIRELLGQQEPTKDDDKQFERQTLGGTLIDDQTLLKLIELGQTDSSVTLLAAPRIRALTGQTATAASSGNEPIPAAVINAGGTTPVTVSTSIEVTPTIIDIDQVLVAIAVEHKRQSAETDVNGVSDTDIHRTTRLKTAVSLKHGQTILLGGTVTSNGTDERMILISATVEILPPTGQDGQTATPERKGQPQPLLPDK